MQSDCHGVYLYSPQCAVRAVYPQAHFTGELYTPTWMFLCLFSSMAVVGHEAEQAEENIHVFYLQLTIVITNPFAQDVCGQLYKRDSKQRIIPNKETESSTSLIRLKKQNQDLWKHISQTRQWMFTLKWAWTVRLLSDVGRPKPCFSQSLPRPLFENEERAFLQPTV